MFLENKYDGPNEKTILSSYTQKMTFKDLIQFQSDSSNKQGWNLNLGFEKCFDNKSHIDFIPIIYQIRNNTQSHHLIVFDIARMEVIRHGSILSNMNVRSHLRISEAGFGEYTLTRTSDIFNQKQSFFTSHSCGLPDPSS